MIQQVHNAEAVELLSTHFPKRNEANYAWGNIMSLLLQLPYLRGLWNFAPRTATFPDLSGNGKVLTNTNTYPTGLYSLTPYVDMAGAGGIRRADEGDLDITPDVSMLGWVRADSFATSPAVLSKWGAAGQRSYWLYFDATGAANFEVTTDGSTIVGITSTGAPTPISTATWHFVAATKSTNTEMNVYLDGTRTQRLAGVPNAIFNSNAPLEAGGANTSGNNLLDGQLAYIALVAGFLPDYLIWAIYELSKPLFGT